MCAYATRRYKHYYLVFIFEELISRFANSFHNIQALFLNLYAYSTVLLKAMHSLTNWQR